MQFLSVIVAWGTLCQRPCVWNWLLTVWLYCFTWVTRQLTLHSYTETWASVTPGQSYINILYHYMWLSGIFFFPRTYQVQCCLLSPNSPFEWVNEEFYFLGDVFLERCNAYVQDVGVGQRHGADYVPSTILQYRRYWNPGWPQDCLSGCSTGPLCAKRRKQETQKDEMNRLELLRISRHFNSAVLVMLTLNVVKLKLKCISDLPLFDLFVFDPGPLLISDWMNYFV